MSNSSVSTFNLTSIDEHYSPTQYLSRRQFHYPHEPDISKVPIDVVDAAEDAVFRYWQKREVGEEEECDPCFSAAPHSEYYGKIALTGGQEIHYSLAVNDFCIHKNKLTGKPFSLMGHTLSAMIVLPKDPNVLWKYEVPYPSFERLRREMVEVSPKNPPGEGETGFPMHATDHEPPMMSFQERLRERLLRLGAIRPSDMHRSNSSDSESGGTSSLAPTSTHATTLVEVLLGDITKRAEESLKPQEIVKDSGLFFPDPVDEIEPVPDLLPAEYSDDGSDESYEPYRTGLCPVCFEPAHEPLSCILLPPIQEEAPLPVERSAPSIIGQRHQVLTRVPEDARIPPFRFALTMSGSRIKQYLQLMEKAGSLRQEMQRFAQGVDSQREERERFIDEMVKELSEAMDTVSEAVSAHQTENHDSRTATGTTRPSSVVTSRADDLELPSFNPSRGEPISRLSWSSSTASSDISSTSDSDEVDPAWERVPVRRYTYTPPPFSESASQEVVPVENDLVDSFQPIHVPVAPFTNRSSSPVTEWVIADHPEREGNPENDKENSSTASSPPPSLRPSDFSTTNHSAADIGNPTDPSDSPAADSHGDAQRSEMRDDNMHRNTEQFRQREILESWVDVGRAHLEEHYANEDFVGGAPIRHAFEILYRTRPLPSSAPSPPNPSQSPTSLDFSLPTNTFHSLHEGAASASSSSSESTAEEGTGAKRKTPDGEHLGQFQEGPRKRFRKLYGESLQRTVVNREAFQEIHEAGPEVVRIFAGIRLAFLEGTKRIEGMVWHRYGVDECMAGRQHNFPSGYVQHPLLFDIEAAKMYAVYRVLLRHQRYETAALLYDVLSLQLRKDYAISHLLNASHLESQYPAGYNRYWDLLPPSAHMEYHTHCAARETSDDEDSNDDSDWDAPGLGYPDSGQEETPLDATSTIAEFGDDAISTHGHNSDGAAADFLYIRRVADWEANAPAPTLPNF
ncbi:hypothetical protein DFH09DRAFT_1308387 [Mycena vulgaris]|nr:hypothetical protein DFH09DRAFT_1308387 [Mycena vulgaris]